MTSPLQFNYYTNFSLFSSHVLCRLLVIIVIIVLSNGSSYDKAVSVIAIAPCLSFILLDMEVPME